MSKRKRDPTFSDSEKNKLVDLVENYLDIVENKKTDNASMQIKIHQWHKIATEFNATCDRYPRDWTVLKNCWENLKKRAKLNSRASKSQQFSETGGGLPGNGIQDPVSKQVLKLIKPRELDPETGGYDSVTTHFLAASNTSETGVEEVREEAIPLWAASNTSETGVEEVREEAMPLWEYYAEEEHKKKMQLLEIRRQAEEEKLKADKIRTEQERIKLEIVKIQLQELKDKS